MITSCKTCNGHDYVCRECTKPWPATNIEGKRSSHHCGRVRRRWAKSRVKCPVHTNTVMLCDSGCGASHEYSMGVPLLPDGWHRLYLNGPRNDMCPKCHARLLVAFDMLQDNPKRFDEEAGRRRIVEAAIVFVTTDPADPIADRRHAELVTALVAAERIAMTDLDFVSRRSGLYNTADQFNLDEIARRLGIRTRDPMARAIAEGARAIFELQARQETDGPPAPALEGSSEADTQE